MEIQLILPYPPALNSLYRVGKGNWYMQKRGKEYKEEVFFLVKQQTVSKGLKLPLDGVLSMDIVAYPPDRRRRDIDGIFKVLLDSLTLAGLYVDDSQIKRLLVSMEIYDETKSSGELQLKIRSYEGLNGGSR